MAGAAAHLVAGRAAEDAACTALERMGYRLLWRYYDAVLDADEVASFARLLDALVLRLVDEPDRPLREVRRTVGAG